MQCTLIDELQFRNDVKSDLGEFILEHLEEHGKKVINGPETS